MKTEVGKRYEVIADLDWISKGSILENTINNKVMLVSGWKKGCKYFPKPSNKYLKEIKEKPMIIKNKFPDYSFKVSTELFNEEGLKAAFEWLRECAIERGLTFESLKDNEKRKYYFNLKSNHVEWDEVPDDDYPDLPEIKLNLETKTVVTGFTVKDDKEETLKDIISKLEQSLEEARDELANLKTIS